MATVKLQIVEFISPNKIVSEGKDEHVTAQTLKTYNFAATWCTECSKHLIWKLQFPTLWSQPGKVMSDALEKCHSITQRGPCQNIYAQKTFWWFLKEYIKTLQSEISHHGIPQRGDLVSCCLQLSPRLLAKSLIQRASIFKLYTILAQFWCVVRICD